MGLLRGHCNLSLKTVDLWDGPEEDGLAVHGRKKERRELENS